MAQQKSQYNVINYNVFIFYSQKIKNQIGFYLVKRLRFRRFVGIILIKYNAAVFTLLHSAAVFCRAAVYLFCGFAAETTRYNIILREKHEYF